MEKSELVFVPSPGVGHLISTVELAKHFHGKQQFSITILLIYLKRPTLQSKTTTYIQSIAASRPGIRFVNLPFVDLPSNEDQNPITFVSLIMEKQKPHVKEAIKTLSSPSSSFSSSSSTPVAALIIDLFATTMIDVGVELSIPTYIYYTSGLGSLGFMLHLPTLDVKIPCEYKDYQGEVEVPSMSPFPVFVLPHPMMNKKVDEYTWYVYHGRRFREAKGLIVNTFAELEPKALQSMSSTYSLSEAGSNPEERWQKAICLEEEMMADAVDESGGTGGGVEGSSEPIGTQNTENSEAPSPKKRNRKPQEPRSDVWREFTRAKNKLTCSCNHCGTVYKCHASKNGTSTLRQHLIRCPHKPKASGQQTELSLQAGYGEVATWKYDAKLICDALTRMIIECELPFRLVEHPRFKEFVAALNPRWKVPSRPTVRKNILDMYEEVKKKLKKIFQNNGSKVSLTTDTWTSEQRQNYMVVTAHFIDSDWALQKKIINFTTIRSHKGEAMGRVIENCLKEWDIKKLFTITVDNASANDLLVNYLKRRYASIVLGEYVHMRCAAHIVNLVVVEGMKGSIASIDRVRAAVKFIRASPERIQKFKECVEIERLESKSLLCLDVCTRWNSTYLMLEVAQKFELAFERFEELEPHITSELAGEGGMPKHEDWINVRRLVTFLRYFYDLTLKVSGSSYITSNSFFHELSILFCVLKEMKCSNDVQMSLMAERMIGKCDKYWGGKSDKLNMLIFVVVVFDPRYKLHYVTLALKVMYDEQTAIALAEKVKLTTFKMFNEYKNEQSSERVNPSQASSSLIVREEEESAEDRAKAVFRRLHSEVGGGETMTELDKYLGENIEYGKDDENFNILTWWKINSSRFPILSVIARDLLAIPISTVSSESAFSTGGRVLDSFRSSLTPTIVEALICVDDWIGGLPLQLVMVEDLSEQEAFEQELAKTKSKNASMGSSRPPMSHHGKLATN